MGTALSHGKLRVSVAPTGSDVGGWKESPGCLDWGGLEARRLGEVTKVGGERPKRGRVVLSQWAAR